jgi:hypothetical protein
VQGDHRGHGRLARLTTAVEEDTVRSGPEENTLPAIGLDAERAGELYAVKGEPHGVR